MSPKFSCWREWLFFALLWALAFSLACRVTDVYPPAAPETLPARLIGSARFGLSQWFVVEADRWFHRGIGHFRQSAFTNLLTRLSLEIKPEEHVHLEGDDVEEIIPWLFFAARMEASNIEAYAIAAYFLAERAGRPELAERLLLEAHRRNPGDYRVFLERGRLALRMGNYADAARLFDAGLRTWPGALDPFDDEALADRAAMLTYRGLLIEMEGDIRHAMEYYDKVTKMFPARHGLELRMKELAGMGRAKTRPSDILKTALSRHARVCDADRKDCSP